MTSLDIDTPILTLVWSWENLYGLRVGQVVIEQGGYIFFIPNKMTPTLAREYKKLQRRVSRETNIFKGFNRIGIKIILSVRRINKD